MIDENASYRAGRTVGGLIRALALGLLLAIAVVGVVGHDASHRVFRYEGF